MFTFTEAKPVLAVIKLEPKAEIHLEPYDDQDPVALNIGRDGSVVEQEDLL
jgi:hypothetical protein